MKKIFFKLFVFFLALIVVCFGVSRILGEELQIVDLTNKIMIVLTLLAAADLTVFLIMEFLSHSKWKKNWKSFCSLLIAAFGLAVIWILFKYLVPDLPIASQFTFTLTELTVLASVVNFICNIFYLIFGSEKLKFRWKLFTFFMVITGICAGLWLLGSTIEAEVIGITAFNIGLLSFSAAVINLIVIITAFIFSRNTNIFFKVFIFLLTLSGSIAAYSFLPLLLGYPFIQRIIFIVAIAVFLFAVLALVVILFRVIFLDRRFMYCDNKKAITSNHSNSEGISGEIIVSTTDDNSY